MDVIAHPPTGELQFTRVDLVWHVPGLCQDYILAHRRTRHPRVRKATCVYDAESITWGGSAFRLMLYDKTKKELGEAGQFVRGEVQLRKHVLNELFEDSEHVLNFEQCYRHFRRFVFQLLPAATTRVSGWTGMMAACLRLSPLENEVHPVEAYLTTLTPRRQRDLRREITASGVERRAIDWAHLLPEQPPEDPPELHLPV